MTEYEKLSLRLLMLIASGISNQLIRPNMTSETRAEFEENVLEWQKHLTATMNDVSDAITREDK